MVSIRFLTGVAFIAVGVALVLLSVFAHSAALEEKNFEMARGDSQEIAGLSFKLADVTADFSRVAFNVYNGSATLATFSIVEKAVPTDLFGVMVVFNSGREDAGVRYANVSFLVSTGAVAPVQKASEQDARANFTQLFPQYPSESLKVVGYDGYWVVSGHRSYATAAGVADIEGRNVSVPSYSFLDGAILFVNKASGAIDRAWKTT